MRYILIVGGELRNKGAQSMTFVTINEIQNRFPQKRIILFSEKDYQLNKGTSSPYTFDIMKPINLRTSFYLWGGIYGLIAKTGELPKNAAKIMEIYKNTDMMIDISGYALGSNWPYWRSVSYMLRIKTAKHFNIPTYLMPQSFGPFDYKGVKGWLVSCLIKRYLKYPKTIFAREQEGYDFLCGRYKLKNVRLSPDLVLLNQDMNIKNIYVKTPESTKTDIVNDTGNVAIIPNNKNFIYGNQGDILAIYKRIMDKLFELNKKIYILRHATEDSDVCHKIKDMYSDRNDVTLITEEVSCIDYDRLVSRFDFLIASRYHSIVHAYKNGVPCIALGWATKYHELFMTFKQDMFIFDVRKNINSERLLGIIDCMNNTYEEQSKIITRMLAEIQRNTVFDELEVNR